jgi:hypothetical protein
MPTDSANSTPAREEDGEPHRTFASADRTPPPVVVGYIEAPHWTFAKSPSFTAASAATRPVTSWAGSAS